MRRREFVKAVAAISASGLEAGTLAADRSEPAATNESPRGPTLSYSGRVADKATGNPIAGATVTVRRSILPDPKTGENRVLQETKHRTGARGGYHFTIPPEQSAQRLLYIELDVEHPEFAPQKHFGYALGMIRKNETLGGRPFFEGVQLRPGAAITGRVETPEGRPAVGVKVLSYSVSSRPEPGQAFEYGSFDDARTDAQGRFRLRLVTPGEAVFWLLPEQYGPSLHAVETNRRGDLGRFVLREGVSIRGKVLDARARPLAGVIVNAERERHSSPEQEILGQLMVADAIRRSATTDARGRFLMAPLPPGTYRVTPAEHSRDASKDDRTRRPLPAVFLPQALTLQEGETPEPLEIRASQHVVIEAQSYDSKGRRRRGHDCSLFGRIGGGFWHTQGRPDRTGKIVIRAPHGLEDAQLDLMTNEHGALRHRPSPGAPLSNSRQVKLGTLDHDVKGIDIICYEAPIVLVRVAPKAGRKPKGARVTAAYPDGKSQYSGPLILPGGLRSDVVFEEQEDGRFRSQQLFPDELVTVTAQADGYRPRAETLKLPEGATQEVELVLEERT
jgi:hypothetical protein